jgi:hypothetical protein
MPTSDKSPQFIASLNSIGKLRELVLRVYPASSVPHEKVFSSSKETIILHSLERSRLAALICCGDGVLDCGRERDIDVGAVGSAERVKAKSWPIISECVIAREMLRRELATKACFRDRKLVGWQARADRGR